MKNPLNFVNNFSTLSAELVDELNDTLKGLPFSNDARAQVNELTGDLTRQPREGRSSRSTR